MNTEDFALECYRLVPLGPWIELAQKANVAHVPADFSPSFPVEQVVKLWGNGLASAFYHACLWVFEEIKTRADAGGRPMFRWECCATLDLKRALLDGLTYSESLKQPGRNPFTTIPQADPRFFVRTVGAETRMCVRPWIEPYCIGGYRVEFRVFFGPDGLLGISNRLIERALPEENWYIDRVVSLTRIAAMKMWSKGDFPAGCTMDFLLVHEKNYEDDHVVFLAGGPPHCDGVLSSHPCCFAWGEIEGIALGPRPGAGRE